MFQSDSNPEPTEVRIFRCGYIAQSRARGLGISDHRDVQRW